MILATVPRQCSRTQGKPFAVVDFEDVLKVAQFAIGLPMIAQSRAAGLDGFLEHVADRLGDRRCGLGGGAARIRQDARRLRGRETGAKQSLGHIDVAQPSDALLVEQTGFERRAGAGEQLRQGMRVKLGR